MRKCQNTILTCTRLLNHVCMCERYTPILISRLLLLLIPAPPLRIQHSCISHLSYLIVKNLTTAGTHVAMKDLTRTVTEEQQKADETEC